MAEINGGSLKYTAEMDISGLKASTRNAKGELVGLSEAASDTGKVIDKAVTEANKVIESQKAVIADLQKKYEELQKTIANAPKEGAVSNDQLQEIEAYKTEVSRLKEEIGLYQRKISDIQTVVKSFTNDNIKLKEELATLKNELLNVAKANVEVQKTSEVFEVTAENIKIQKDVIADLEKQYKDLQKAISDIAPGQAQAALMQDAASLATEIELEKNALSDLENYVRENAGNHETLRQKLIQVKNEMIQLAAAGQRDSDRYQELAQQADEYQEAIDEVNATMQSLSGNSGLNAVVETVGLAASGMAVYQGVTALAGVENENLEKIMVRLQATMSIAIGVQQLQNALQRNSAVIQSVLAFQATMRARAEALATATTLRATIAQRAFNIVANANPYVLLATAILTVVGALALMSSGNQKAAEDQKKINEATAESAAGQIVAYKQLQNEYESLGNSLKAKEKFIEDNKDKFHDLGVEIENVSDAERFFVAGSDTFISSLMLRAQAAANAQLAVEKYKESIEASMNSKMDSSAEETLRYNNDPNNSAVSKWIRGIFYKDDLSKAIETQNTADKFMKREAELLEKADALRDKVAKSTATPPAQGTELFYREEINRLENLKSKAQVGSKEWENYGKQIKKIQDLINPPKPKKAKKAQDLAEVFDVGSMTRLQQQISLIDRSLARMGKDGVVSLQMIDKYGKEYTSKQVISLEEAKNKRLQLANELAEAEKRIQIKSIKDTFDENNKLWNQYYSAVESIGSDAANRIYSDLLKNGESRFEQLKKLQEDLVMKDLWGNLSDEDKEVLTEVNNAINELTGKQSSLDAFKNTLQQTLSGMKNDTERLLYVQEKIKNLSNQDVDSGKAASLAETEREIQNTLQNQYQEFLNEQETFEQKKLAIEIRYAEIRKRINSDSNIDETERLRLLESAAKAEAREYSTAFLDVFKKTKLWEKAFGDIDALTKKEISQLIPVLEAQISELIRLDTPIEEIERFRKKLDELKYFASGRNPITRLIENFKELRKRIKEGTATQSDFQKLQNSIRETEVYIKMAVDAAKELSEALGIGADGGPFEKFAKDLTQTVEGLINAIVGYLSGNAQQMVGGIIQMFVGVVKMLSTAGDGRKEANIRAWKMAVDDLKFSYDELQKVIEKTAGEEQIDMQRELIVNLREQQRILTEMRSKEAQKKKADQNVINDYTSQIRDINSQITDIIDNFQKTITSTDFKDWSQKIADALIDTFGKGEDALDSFDKVVDNVMRNAVANALRIKILEPAVKEMTDQLYSSLGFSGQSGANTQQAQLLSSYQQALNQAQQNLANASNPIAATNYESQIKYYKELIQKLQSEIATNVLSGSFDGLTPEEQEEIKNLGVGAMNQYVAALEQYEQLFGAAAGNAQSMKGDIKGVTEKTAGALEGQINAIRIFNVKIGNENQIIFKNSLQNLVKIEYNTRHLIQMQKDISEMNSKIKYKAAGIP